MRRRTKAILAVVCLFFTAVVWGLLSSHENEPSYQGKPLSYYLRLNDRYYGGKLAERKSAAEAIRQIGTNAIPFLMKWIQYDESPGMLEFRAKLDTKLGTDWFYSRGGFRANLCINAFHALGPTVGQAISPLTRLAIESKSDEVATRAIYALADTGSTDAIPPLLFCLTNGPASRRSTAADAFQYMDKSVAALAVPALVERLKDTDSGVAHDAAFSLGQLKLDAEQVVPALAEASKCGNPLVQSFAEGALEDYGPVAKSSIPTLLELCNSTNREVRWYATNALHAIAPETYTNSGYPLQFEKQNGHWVPLY